MDLELAQEEIRVLGCLVEKEALTPDIYPLSLAALTAACNQKTSRDPVMALSETDVQNALDSLVRQHLVRERAPSGSRVPKYAHRLAPSLGLTFDFTPEELALLCVLMLRGPQTPGELRTRVERQHHFDDVDEVESALEALATRERGPYVRVLPRQAGRREARYMQLFGGDTAPAEDSSAPTGSSAADNTAAGGRLADLEARVDQLEQALAAIQARLGGVTGADGT